eukprot:8205651-Pyramimonas_sp.AAC.1
MATGSAGRKLGNVSGEEARVECYGLLGADAENAARTGRVGATAQAPNAATFPGQDRLEHQRD